MAGRIYTSKKFPEVFYDKMALSLAKKIHVKEIIKRSDEYVMLANAARYANMDSIVKAFIQKHKQGNIINIGAGLETMYYRMETNRFTFYEVDLPEVIETRRKYLKESERERFIGCDVFNRQWMETIDKSQPSIVIASGLFQYFKEDQVVDLLNSISEELGDVEIVFDATNKKGLEFANRFVEKTGNTNARMFFSIDRIEEFTGLLDNQPQILSEQQFFAKVRPLLKGKIKVKTNIYIYVHVR